MFSFLNKPSNHPLVSCEDHQLQIWEGRINKIHCPELKSELACLRSYFDSGSYNNFRVLYNHVLQTIDSLSASNKLLFNNEVAYKISKSSPDVREYFSEHRYIEYPEFSAVFSPNKLSFTNSKKALINCLRYGDQLTIVGLNDTHPQFDAIRNIQYEFRGGVFSEYAGETILVGKNISIQNPYLLKDIILLSCQDRDYRGVINMFFPIVGNTTLGDIYRDLGYEETSRLFFKMKKTYESNGYISAVEELRYQFPNDNRHDNLVDQIVKVYLDECLNLVSKSTSV